jgi:sec-independent protein translocase protein TatA
MGTQELVIVLVIALVLFGGSQLPKLARNLGKAQKEFKDGLSEGEKDAVAEKEAAAAEAERVAALKRAEATEAAARDASTRPDTTA